MIDPETPLARAERQVREDEARVAHQEAVVAKLMKDGHEQEAIFAEEVLTTLRHMLDAAREHLRNEQGKRVS